MNDQSSPGFPIQTPSKSHWLENLPPSLLKLRDYQSSPNLPATVLDVCIIGSGMTGASVAYHLNQTNTNLSIAVLEGRGLCSGATGRNGGFLHAHSFNQWWPLYEKYGIFKATTLVLLEQAGRNAIHKIAYDESFECDIDKNVKLAMLFPKHEDLQKKLGKFHAFRHNLLSVFGVNSIDTKEECAKIFNLDSMRSDKKIESAIVINKGCDTFWPAKFVLEIFSRLIERDVHVQTNTMVTKVTQREEDGLYVIETTRGVVLTKNVVHATNAWIGSLVPDLKDVIKPVLNTVVSTEPTTTPPLLNEENRRTGMDLQPGYHYWHSRKDGRIILGGFRNSRTDRGVDVWKDGEASKKDIQTAENFLYNLGFFKALTTNKIQIERAWTGIIGWSMDGMPWVGALSDVGTKKKKGLVDSGREYVAAGFSGHGMTQTWLCGKEIATMITSNGGGIPMLLPTKNRIMTAQKKGGDWLEYEKAKKKKNAISKIVKS